MIPDLATARPHHMPTSQVQGGPGETAQGLESSGRQIDSLPRCKREHLHESIREAVHRPGRPRNDRGGRKVHREKDWPHVLLGATPDQRDLDYPRRDGLQCMHYAGRVRHRRPHAIHYRFSHRLAGGTRPAKRTPCSIKITEHASPTCGKEIHQESGGKSTAA